MISFHEPSLIARWRRRFGGPHCRCAQPRPVAAMGYLVNGPVIEGLIELEKLLLVLLYDEPQENGTLSLRLAGYSSVRAPWGMMWGGAEQCRFFKDLLLYPTPQARGRRLDATRGQLLQLALRLDGHLTRHARYPWLIHRPHLQLPRLWAGFRASHVAHLSADGPELEAYCCRTGKSPSQSLEQSHRNHEGLTLFPLEWVSHQWRNMTAVFADLRCFPKWQVFPLRHMPEDLQGFQKAAEYDFYSSRFRFRSTVNSQRQGINQELLPAAV
jgi:hypothetical protein